MAPSLDCQRYGPRRPRVVVSARMRIVRVVNLSCTMPAYCSAELQGIKCTDTWCQYRHDIIRCEPCGRSFPASLLNQHENGKLHLGNVYLSTLPPPTDLWDVASADGWDQVPIDSDPCASPWSFPPQPASLSPQSSPPQLTSPLSPRISFAAVADPRVIVSDENGLDFIVKGTETATCPCFPVARDNILIEKTTVVSSLSVESMTLESSPGQWCEWFGPSVKTSYASPRSFSAFLIGTTTVIRKKNPRTIIVSFNAPHAGTFHAVLQINFSDKTRPHDPEFIIRRELRGRAVLPASDGLDSNTDVPTLSEEMAESDDNGLIISPDFALEFSVESPQPNEPFTTQTKQLTITRSSNTLVSFTAARIYSPDNSMIG